VKIELLRETGSYPKRAHKGLEERFSLKTRTYLMRRAWRYFRRLGHKDPKRYGRAIRSALIRYDDAHLEKPEQLLDCWGLMHALYWASPVIVRDRRGILLASGQSLEDLHTAPIFPDAWLDCFDDLVAMLAHAKCRLVRVFVIGLLEQTYRDALAKIPLERLLGWLRSPHEELERFALSLLQRSPDLDQLPLERWLELLELDNPTALPLIAELVEKHVSPARLNLAQCVKLAGSRAAPVAALGLKWTQEKPIRTEIELRSLLGLVQAPAPRVRETAVTWLLGLLTSSPLAQPIHLREVIDSKFEDARQPALALLEKDARFGSTPELWAAIAETPYDDVRAFLVGHLEAKQKTIRREDLLHVWASALLAIHRGGKAKRSVVKQVADRIADNASEAAQLLPLLGIALRSVRPSERRPALAAIARAAFVTPALRSSIAAQLPELKLLEESAS
jgi:hypothetical protein